MFSRLRDSAARCRTQRSCFPVVTQCSGRGPLPRRPKSGCATANAAKGKTLQEPARVREAVLPSQLRAGRPRGRRRWISPWAPAVNLLAPLTCCHRKCPQGPATGTEQGSPGCWGRRGSKYEPQHLDLEIISSRFVLLQTFYSTVLLVHPFQWGIAAHARWVSGSRTIYDVCSPAGSNIIQTMLRRDICRLHCWLDCSLIGSMLVWSMEGPPLKSG